MRTFFLCKARSRRMRSDHAIPSQKRNILIYLRNRIRSYGHPSISTMVTHRTNAWRKRAQIFRCARKHVISMQLRPSLPMIFVLTLRILMQLAPPPPPRQAISECFPPVFLVDGGHNLIARRKGCRQKKRKEKRLNVI